MEFAKVNVEVRSRYGQGWRAQGARRRQGSGRRLRAQGRAGRGDLRREGAAQLARQGEARNTVLTLAISGGGKSEEVTAMVRDAQIDPLSRRLVHVDFLRVDLDAEVHVTVPLVLTGKAVGTTNGGNLHQSMHVIPIAAKPAAIPTKLEVDVTRARHRRRAPRQRPQAGRGRARAARPARRHRVGRGAEGREGRGRGGARSRARCRRRARPARRLRRRRRGPGGRCQGRRGGRRPPAGKEEKKGK